MTVPSLRGRRIVVVGASSGIGRSFAIAAVRAGADVVLTARRKDRLAEAIETAGGGTPVESDVTSADDCQRAAEEIMRVFPTIDVVMYAAGVAPMAHIEETSAAEWQQAMAVNVVGFTVLTTALLRALAPGAVVAVTGSETVGHSRYGLAAYSASKAALDNVLRSWRLEHPAIRFTNLAIGPTQGTEFGNAFRPEMLGRAWRAWELQGLNQKVLMQTDDVGESIAYLVGGALAVPGVALEDVTLRAASGVFDRSDLP
jgi:NAD(P)-dependent dehydrogenase (short-subunit alcohol dehydrogenase family)